MRLVNGMNIGRQSSKKVVYVGQDGLTGNLLFVHLDIQPVAKTASTSHPTSESETRRDQCGTSLKDPHTPLQPSPGGEQTQRPNRDRLRQWPGLAPATGEARLYWVLRLFCIFLDLWECVPPGGKTSLTGEPVGTSGVESPSRDLLEVHEKVLQRSMKGPGQSS